jgi:hypothetical protein
LNLKEIKKVQLRILHNSNFVICMDFPVEKTGRLTMKLTCRSYEKNKKSIENYYGDVSWKIKEMCVMDTHCGYKLH